MMQRTENESHFLLSIALLITSLSLIEPVLLWIQVLVFCSAVMRFALFFNLQKHLPTIRTINLLAILSAIVLVYSGWHLGLLLGMVNLLVMASALKLMTMRKHQDYFRLICTVFFLVGCGFIFQQSILYSLIYSLIIFMLLLSLAFHISPNTRLNKQAYRIGLQCLQATPIAILLFLVIPKIDPLWRMPSAKNAETGLSETVTPGDIADLSQSTELAFRATFNGAIPTAQQRYWRAIVLEHFDGHTWSIAPQRKTTKAFNWQLRQSFQPNVTGAYFDYEVIAEPTHQTWLYALDIAQSSDAETWLSRDYQLQRTKPMQSQFKYQVKSYFNAELKDEITGMDRELNLQLPKEGNPKTQSWVLNLRARHSSEQEFINAVNQHFLTGKYRYTLRPFAMPHNPIDQFLFDDKAGFCAHYAGAMTYIMRLAGIPARMVTGYLGGEMHGQDYMSVYQYDAHAWVEVLQQDKGWVRYDPTSLVAPDRLLYGLEAAVAYEDSFLSETPFALAKLKNIEWLNQIRMWMENADYLWSRWLLGFDQKKQLNLFESIIGNLSPYRIAALTLGVMLIIGILLALFHYRIWFPKIDDPLLHAYQQALETLRRNGIVKPKSMAASDFVHVVNQYGSEQYAQQFNMLSEEFIKLRYQQAQASPEQLQQFKRNVALFQKRFKKRG
ncbi:DUF3488 domain-containing transglutaminase family protein [Paraneptunicella aestuarii]|uniref:transglutaminase family protein n=1 Tax=Paraneptunicella aestuarii TaxID=2831148 RepID=UPI001E2BA798|nr:DUF3488 and transglutaminase-like domain-containing protein [Paraneptunicella aestuarii]UAA40196.1 DUF3488 domain-containing transglutaminase family protein [Paraneptunicella aestuarii]